MKLPAVILVGSLAANAALALLFVSRPEAARALFRPGAGARPAHPPPSQAPTPGAAGFNASTAPGTDAKTVRVVDWANLQPTDFSAVLAHLSSLGIPPPVARRLTAELIDKYYDQRRRAARSPLDPLVYWRNPHVRPETDDLAKEREFEREKRRLLREIVGLEPGVGDPFDDDAQRRQFGQLPEAKIAALKKIFADYADLEEQLFGDGADRNSPALRARAALLAQEKRADIERLLSPDELLDYDLRNSPGAHHLRGRLGAFAATEAEFRALFPAFKAVADAEMAAHYAGRTHIAELRRNRETVEKQLEAELRRVLGPRFAEFQEANDQGLRETRALITSLNLPPALVQDVVAIQKEFQPQLQALDRSRDLTANQRDAQLGTLAIQARDRLIRVLGAEGFEAYKRRGGGWIGLALSRAAPTPSSP